MSVPDRSAPRPRAGRRVRAYIGLGANLGDAAATLAWAVDQLDARPTITVHRVSPLYATAPWGVTDQPEFRNAVAVVDVRGPSDPDHAAIALLSDLKSIERAA
ncbi:MAG: 2-amino-4-hydroxy-6-hydroxymethyldihydropteridine diphosphokinase, partial [Candidatus Limnocylindrales bacterium]